MILKEFLINNTNDIYAIYQLEIKKNLNYSPIFINYNSILSDLNI